MARERVLLLENDAPLQDVLCYVFRDENLDVTVCTSLAELQASIVQFPEAAVVSDSLRSGDYQTLSPSHRAELVALAETSEVVLTTGQEWARHAQKGALGTLEIVEKPYDLDLLMGAVRAALARTSTRVHGTTRDAATGESG